MIIISVLMKLRQPDCWWMRGLRPICSEHERVMRKSAAWALIKIFNEVKDNVAEVPAKAKVPPTKKVKNP